MDPCTELLLAEAYSPCTGLEHLTQVMGLHPQYLQSFLQSHFYLLWMDGPLPLHCRQYLAIMVSAFCFDLYTSWRLKPRKLACGGMSWRKGCNVEELLMAYGVMGLQ